MRIDNDWVRLILLILKRRDFFAKLQGLFIVDVYRFPHTWQRDFMYMIKPLLKLEHKTPAILQLGIAHDGFGLPASA